MILDPRNTWNCKELSKNFNMAVYHIFLLMLLPIFIEPLCPFIFHENTKEELCNSTESCCQFDDGVDVESGDEDEINDPFKEIKLPEFEHVRKVISFVVLKSQTVLGIVMNDVELKKADSFSM